MKEAIFIIAYILGVYFLFSFFKTRYISKYKWWKPIQYTITILLFVCLFYKRIDWPGKSGNITLTFLLFVSLIGYFVFKVYSETRLLNKQEK